MAPRLLKSHISLTLNQKLELTELTMEDLSQAGIVVLSLSHLPSPPATERGCQLRTNSPGPCFYYPWALILILFFYVPQMTDTVILCLALSF